MKTADAPLATYPVHWPAARSWTRLAVRTHNPLLRPPTRREWIVTRLAFGGLVVVIAALLVLCLTVLQRGLAAERDQAAQRHRITATVQSAGDPKLIGNRYLVSGRAKVGYEFGGAWLTGVTTSPRGATAGSSITAWVDDSGQLVGEPRSRALTVRDTVLTCLLGLIALFAMVGGGRAAYDAWSVRQHADAWDEEWLRLDHGRRA